MRALWSGLSSFYAIYALDVYMFESVKCFGVRKSNDVSNDTPLRCESF